MIKKIVLLMLCAIGLPAMAEFGTLKPGYVVYDGDTVNSATIDIGWGIQLTNQKIRILGIDAPEVRGGTVETKLQGIISRDALKDLLSTSTKITVNFLKMDSFGRRLCTLSVESSGKTVDVSEYMISTGMATKYKK